MESTCKNCGTIYQTVKRSKFCVECRYKKFVRICKECGKHMKSVGIYHYIVRKEVTCGECLVSGCKNPMYGKPSAFLGKHHTKLLKQQFSEQRKGKPVHTDASKKILSDKNKGTNNSMYGKSVESVWKIKYSDEEVNQRIKHRNELLSAAFSGEKNPMYGKPSPKGSGNGISGWYKGWYFRSIGELSFMIKYIERFNMKWINAESKQYKIPYVHNNTNKNYFADFIINDKYIVEVKPKALQNTDINKIKKQYAELFCAANGLKYKLIAPVRLSDDEMKELILSNKITLLERFKPRVYKRLNLL